jgi:hypothetical protein
MSKQLPGSTCTLLLLTASAERVSLHEDYGEDENYNPNETHCHPKQQITHPITHHNYLRLPTDFYNNL